MPFIQVTLSEDEFTAVQKNQIITTLTDAMVSIQGNDTYLPTSVVIEEVDSQRNTVGKGSESLEAAHASFESFFIYGCF